MRKDLHLRVLTPVETRLDIVGVAWVQLRLADGGGLGIYPGHAPLLAETVTASLRYADASGEHALDLPAGVLYIHDNVVTLFSVDAFAGDILAGDEPARFDRLARALLSSLGASPPEELENVDAA